MASGNKLLTSVVFFHRHTHPGTDLKILNDFLDLAIDAINCINTAAPFNRFPVLSSLKYKFLASLGVALNS